MKINRIMILIMNKMNKKSINIWLKVKQIEQLEVKV